MQVVNELDEAVRELMRLNVYSPCALVQQKTKKALADLKRARTLIEKAKLTAKWAEAHFWDNSTKV